MFLSKGEQGGIIFLGLIAVYKGLLECFLNEFILEIAGKQRLYAVNVSTVGIQGG
jgi:hypothetical protein